MPRLALHFYPAVSNDWGNQSESPASWCPEPVLDPHSPRATVAVEGRRVQVQGWRYSVRGVNGRSVPVYLLDTDVEENAEQDRRLTDHLYGGDRRYRLCRR